MTPFANAVEGIAVAIDAPNIDTDQILPARFLLKSRNAGYADLLFHDHRFFPDGRPRAGFPLDRPTDAPIRFLVANDNFGCGSAREQAAYALADFGVQVVIAPSLGEIFRVNCIRNGVVPALVSPQESAVLRERARNGDLKLRLRLRDHQIDCGDITLTFRIGPDDVERLISGMDEIDSTLALHQAIAGHEARRRDLLPAPAPASRR